jgi:crotonobetainyl-CoA:carnitine CoA-transferase CaiB-like acyl-CoA transferase
VDFFDHNVATQGLTGKPAERGGSKVPGVSNAPMGLDVTFEQRGIMQTMIHPVHRPFKMPAWPVRVDGKATRVTSSPVLGEHTDHALSDWLGLNAAAVAALKSEGVV